MNPPQNNIKERLKKLLNLADDQSASSGEVANAMRMARKLMVEHGLSRDSLKDSEFLRLSVENIGKNLSTWEAQAAIFICDLVGYVTPIQGRGRLDFFGPGEDVRTTADLYTLTRDTIKATALLLYDGWYRGDGALYAQGYVLGLSEAHKKASQQLEAEDTALMVQDAKQQAEVKARAKAWLQRTENIRTRKGSRRTGAQSGSAEAFYEGRRDGRNHKVK